MVSLCRSFRSRDAVPDAPRSLGTPLALRGASGTTPRAASYSIRFGIAVAVFAALVLTAHGASAQSEIGDFGTRSGSTDFGARSDSGDLGALSGLWDFGINLKFESDRFRARGNMRTPEHFWDMRLDGSFDPGKLLLDGRVEQDGRGLDFRFEGEITTGFGRVPSF